MNDNHIADERKKVVAWRWMPSPMWGEYVLTGDWRLAKLSADEGLIVEGLCVAAPIAPRADADTAGANKLIAELRDRADSDEMAASEIDPLHYTPDEPESIAAGLEFHASERRECADMLEKQAAVIAEQGHKIAAYIAELEARATLARADADTAGAKLNAHDQRWIENRAAIIEAIDKAGFALSSNKNGWWLAKRPVDDGNCQSCVADKCTTGKNCVTLGWDAYGCGPCKDTGYLTDGNHCQWCAATPASSVADAAGEIDVEGAIKSAMGSKYCAQTAKPAGFGWLSPSSADRADLEADAAGASERADAEKDAALTEVQIDVLITEHSEWTPQGYAIVDSHRKAFARAILAANKEKP